MNPPPNRTSPARKPTGVPTTGTTPYHAEVGKVTTCTVTDLNSGTTYYFVATCYNKVGTESGFSNQVSTRTPSVDPNWIIADTGDSKGDCSVDILWRNATTGENLVGYMSGLAVIRRSDYLGGGGSPN